VHQHLKEFLDQKVEEFNTPSFISKDPISIPHAFIKKQDIEIAGFFAAVFAWGNRTIIINKSKELLTLMDNAPYDFITSHSDKELQRLLAFKHRTFNTTDLLYFILFLRHHYAQAGSLETAFTRWMSKSDMTVENALTGFHDYFFSMEDAPVRTRKHIATPARNSTCKRLNMFLRWMVRHDDKGVDFGIWNKISPAQLVCPVDVHVTRVATRLGLMEDRPVNWKAAISLTERLKEFDRADPCKYDFALFGIGVREAH
jgi:uncharacterized protein (TIGR02757 family)